jgi:Putative bacterial sensory transduction regulator
MKELFGTTVEPGDDGLAYRVHFGSASVYISVSPWGDNEAVILARAPVVSGTDLTPELMSYLLRKNCETRFGAFGISESGDIELRYSLVGSTCQKEELRASVRYLMLAADLCDDEIVARWGGRRALDVPRS